MKILLISDIHWGVKKNSEFFINVIRDYFNKEVIPTIEKHNIKQLWILGDYFDDRYTTNVLVENIALKTIKQILSKFKNIEVFILAGNHDIYYKNSLSISSLKKFRNISKRLEIIDGVKEYKIDNLKVIAIPWLIHGSKNWDEFKKIITKYEETNKKQYDLCFGHFEINGFEIIKNLVEKGGLNQKMFEAFGEVFTGHFHIRNKIGNIQYLGSPYEITWNDYGTKKGLTIYDTENNKATFIENKISPKHEHFNISSIKKDSSLLDEMNNNLIKFHIDESIEENELSNILTKIDNKNLFDLQIIDERYDDIDDENIDEIEDLIDNDALQYAIDYIEQLDHPDEIEIDK